MQKNKKRKWDTRTVVFLGAMVAVHIMLTRLVVIDLGSYRITVGNLAIVLSGLWFGPLGGAVCGLVADILGCLLKGYAVNPLITLAAVLWGVIPGIASYLLGRGSKVRKIVTLCVAIVVNSICSTLIFTTMGLVLFNGYNFYAIMPGRVAQWAIMTPIYCVLTCILYFSPLTSMVKSAAFHKNAAANA